MGAQPPVRRVWVSVVGWSPMAVINTLWGACEQGIVPTHLILLASEDKPEVQKSIQIVEKYARALLAQFGVPDPLIETRPIDEDDLKGFWETLKQVMVEVKNSGERIVLDITAGRKYMSALGMALGRWGSIGLEKLYYTHLHDQRYTDVPYPLIPRHQHRLYDLLETFQ